MRTKTDKRTKNKKATPDNEPKTSGDIRKNNNKSKDPTFEQMQDALTGLYD